MRYFYLENMFNSPEISKSFNVFATELNISNKADLHAAIKNTKHVAFGHYIHDSNFASYREITKSEYEIYLKIYNVFSGLSPENISCDGEASRSHIKRMQTKYAKELKVLYGQLGQKKTLNEVLEIASHNV